MDLKFTSDNFTEICDKLSVVDQDLSNIIQSFGYPPMWTRPNSFETLVHIILEQQVSLASALASLNKLKERLIIISPEGVLSLTDEELKSCYFSRQKTVYVRQLAVIIINGQIDLNSFELLSNDEIRAQLYKLKGVGNWTIDIYLMFALQRQDIFPIGDLAAVNAFRQIKKMTGNVTRDQIAEMSLSWQPYRTIATMLLWHFYLSQRITKKK